MKKTAFCTSLIILFAAFYTGLRAQIFEVKQGDKWGFIDEEGNILIPARYDFIYDDYEYSRQEEGYFAFRQGEFMGVYKVGEGELVPPEYEKVKVFSNLNHHGYIEIQKEGKTGLLDTIGNELVHPFCDELNQLLPGVFSYRQEDAWGIMSLDSSLAISADFDSVYSELNNFVIGVRSGYYSAWHTSGRRLFADRESPMSFLSDHVLTYMAEDTSLYGMADSMAESITEAVYDTLWSQQGFIMMRQGSDFGLASHKGEIFLEAVYGRIVVDETRRVWYQSSSGSWGIMSAKGDTIAPPMFSRRGSFTGNLAVITQGSGWGVINQFGDILTERGYDVVRFEFGAILLRLDDEWTQIPVDEDGRRMLRRKLIVKSSKPAAEFAGSDSTVVADPVFNIDPRTVGWFKHRGLWGWRDTATREIRIEPVFTDIKVIPGHGVSMVMHDVGGAKTRLVGLADHRRGRIITKPELNMIYIRDFIKGEVARAQYSTGAFVLIHISGQVRMLARTGYISPFNEGISRAYVGGEYAGLVKEVGDEPNIPRRGGKWGYLTLSGKWGVKPVFDDMADFSYGVGALKYKGKWGAVDTLFNTIIPPQYDTLFVAPALSKDSTGREPLICTMLQRKKYFYLDEMGNLRFSYQFDESGDFYEGLARVRKENKWGYLDSMGRIAIPVEYERAGDFHEGVARIRTKLRWGFVDGEGNYQVEPQYMGAGDFSDGMALVKEGARYGYIRQDGNWQIKPVYRRAGDFFQGRAIVRKNNDYGVIDHRGNWVIPPRFSRIDRDGDFFKVRQKGLYGFYDFEGNELIGTQCNFVGDFVNGLARIRMGRLYGFMDSTRQAVIYPSYSMVKNFRQGISAVRLDGKWGAIDQRGDTVISPVHNGIQISRKGEVRVLGENKFWRELTLQQMPKIIYRPGTDTASVYGEIFRWVKGHFGYDEIRGPREGIIVASCDKLYGLARTTGEILFEPRFEKVRARGGLYKVVEDGNIGYLNGTGAWVYAINGVMRE